MFCANLFSELALYNQQMSGSCLAMIFLTFCFRPGEHSAKKKETKKKATTHNSHLSESFVSTFFNVIPKTI